MVTGCRPFPEKHSPQLINNISHQPIRPPSSVNSRVSPGLESIILKALDKDPELRYQSARELRVDLSRLQSPTSGSAAQPITTTRTTIQSKRTGIVVAASLVLAILAVLVGLQWRSQ